MKNWMQRARLTVILLSGIFSLAMLTGCESLQDTAFAPAEARLEPIPGGGAQHFVVVNTSGRTLHNYHFQAYLWDDQTVLYSAGLQPKIPRRVQVLTYTLKSSGSKWEPGEELRLFSGTQWTTGHLSISTRGGGSWHAKDWNLPGEIPILKPVSQAQIAGSCDEGDFHEAWQINASGQLELVRSAKN